ncbi:MAG: Npun_F5749 family FMN-dependent PPOX-type flavoprotein [Leptolyngbya sp.]|nr:Npun_F5749 family FMN-dependent PPOX-type flavoprotein [Leptolyngbya sp.]
MSDFGTAVVTPEALAPWRSPLAKALHRHRSQPHSRYAQLATLSAHGRPANRTVVFRGFYQDSNALMFVTDSRSAKVMDITQTPWGELCWYFTQTREQFRLSGAIALITASTEDWDLGQARRERWEALSEASRQSFLWPHPGHPRGGDIDAVEGGFEVEPPDQPPSTFCLGLLQPDGVDHLELRGHPQNRTQYQRLADGTWVRQAVNP